MKILLVDAYPRTTPGRKAFLEFRQLVEAKVRSVVECECEIIIKHYTQLETYVYVKKEMSGLDEAVRHAARDLFDEADMDGNGSLDEYELLRMLTNLFQKMGMPVKTDQLPRLKQEVRIAVARYDTDDNGTLEFDEVAEMLCVDPWRELLPSDSLQKENALLAIKNFCYLDMVIVDGNPDLMPWLPEAEDLLQLISQVVYSQGFSEGTGITLFGTAVATQVVQYLACVGQRMLPIFNGLSVGLGSSMRGTQRALHDIDTSVPCIQPPPDAHGEIGQGGMFLDNSTGIVYEYDPAGAGRTNVIEGSSASNAAGAWHCVSCNWKRVVNVGIVCNGSRTSGLRNQYRPQPISGPVMEDSCITRANLVSARFHHWLFEGVGGTSIVGPCARTWDVVLREGTGMSALATGKRGPEIIEMHKLLIGTMFSVHKEHPDTVTLLNNYITKRVSEFTQAQETKHAWYMYMLTAASDGFLHLQYLPPQLADYGQMQRTAAAEANAKQVQMLKLERQPTNNAIMQADAEIMSVNHLIRNHIQSPAKTKRRSMRGAAPQPPKGSSRLPALRLMPDASRTLRPTKYEMVKPVFATRIQTPPSGLPGHPSTLSRDGPRKLTPGQDTVRDYVLSTGYGGYQHPPYMTTGFVEEPKRLMREENMHRHGIPTNWHSGANEQGFGPRPDSCIKYDRHMTKVFDTNDNSVHFDKHCRGNWMTRVDKSAWLRRSSVSGKPTNFRGSFAGTQIKWPMNLHNYGHE